MRKTGAGLCLFLMVGFSACDDDDEELKMVDNQRFFDEFSASGMFGDWDFDSNELLDETEFNMGFFELWDLDGDGFLDANEFSTATMDFNIADANMAAWDEDNNGVLEMNEFDWGFTPYGFNDRWGVDSRGAVDKREFTDGVFGLWDTDADGRLTQVEYNTLYARYFGA